MISFIQPLVLITSLSSLVESTPLSLQKPLGTADLSPNSYIPGGTTFKYCPESDPENDIFTIEKIVWEPNPPRISRDQNLFIYGNFAERIPSTAYGIGEVHIPEFHDPYDPATNFTDTNPYCAWPNYIYQSDEKRGVHKVCDGRVDGNDSAPEAGPAVLVSEDFLFWPLPDGEYYLKLDMLMPNNTDGSIGKRISCFEVTVDLDY